MTGVEPMALAAPRHASWTPRSVRTSDQSGHHSARLRLPVGKPGQDSVINAPSAAVRSSASRAVAVAYPLSYGELPAVDDQGRPLFAYGQRSHDACPRRAHFDAGSMWRASTMPEPARAGVYTRPDARGPIFSANRGRAEPCASVARAID